MADAYRHKRLRDQCAVGAALSPNPLSVRSTPRCRQLEDGVVKAFRGVLRDDGARLPRTRRSRTRGPAGRNRAELKPNLIVGDQARVLMGEAMVPRTTLRRCR